MQNSIHIYSIKSQELLTKVLSFLINRNRPFFYAYHFIFVFLIHITIHSNTIQHQFHIVRRRRLKSDDCFCRRNLQQVFILCIEQVFKNIISKESCGTLKSPVEIHIELFTNADDFNRTADHGILCSLRRVLFVMVIGNVLNEAFDAFNCAKRSCTTQK